MASFNPLFLYGGVGLGKTHLMHAIAWHVRRREPSKRVIYLSAEKFMFQFVKAVRFKDTTSRWGSCSSDGNLSFSWRIMMAPPAVIDYLVAHEVAHLKEMNHGPKFWKLCRELCPRTDEAKAWLQRNGSALQAIGFG